MSRAWSWKLWFHVSSSFLEHVGLSWRELLLCCFAALAQAVTPSVMSGIDGEIPGKARVHINVKILPLEKTLAGHWRP